MNQPLSQSFRESVGYMKRQKSERKEGMGRYERKQKEITKIQQVEKEEDKNELEKD
jgi:hypothetical protein